MSANTGWTFEFIRANVDRPMLDALFRQWKRCPPLPVALQRFARYFGLPEPKVDIAQTARPLDEKSFAALRKFIPVIPHTHHIEPMSPEDFRKLHHG